jgi:hypothetical protein
VPLDRKASSPLILAPKVHVLLKIHRANHLSNTTEMGTLIDLLDNDLGSEIQVQERDID